MRPLILAVLACGVAGGVLLGGATRAPAASRTLVTFARTGGFAGTDDRLRVGTDRIATIRHRGAKAHHRTLTVAALRKLRHALDAARLGDPVSSDKGASCSDCFEFTISYGGHTAMLSQLDVPERMGPAFEQLTALLER